MSPRRSQEVLGDLREGFLVPSDSSATKNGLMWWRIGARSGDDREAHAVRAGWGPFALFYARRAMVVSLAPSCMESLINALVLAFH